MTSFLTAVSFSLALRLSNLTSPQRVLSFLILPFNSSFDPSLAFLAVGALPLATALYRKWGRGLCPKNSAKVDWRLVTGAAVFGVGWGMEGICRTSSIHIVASTRLMFIALVFHKQLDLGWSTLGMLLRQALTFSHSQLG